MLVLTAGLPGFAVGIVTGYAFLVLPIVLTLGLATARSELAVRLSLVGFSLLILGFAFTVGLARDEADWWFFAVYGTSDLFALLATFKAGMVLRLRLF